MRLLRVVEAIELVVEWQGFGDEALGEIGGVRRVDFGPRGARSVRKIERSPSDCGLVTWVSVNLKGSGGKASPWCTV